MIMESATFKQVCNLCKAFFFFHLSQDSDIVGHEPDLQSQNINVLLSILLAVYYHLCWKVKTPINFVNHSEHSLLASFHFQCG